MKNIREFLSEDPMYYDFTDNCTSDEDYMEKKGYDKYFAYRTQNNVGDPDSCSTLLQEIYKALWPELIGLNYMVSDGKIYSDTMTSVQHTLGKYYEAVFQKEIEEYKKANSGQKFVSALMCKNMFEQFENVKKTLKNNTNLKHFISVYHTIGNYSPVPGKFNGARSGGGAFDYWDLTLMKIKKFFDLRGESKMVTDEALLQVIHLVHCEDKETINNCLLWLNSYSSWEEFITKNFFQDYVDNNGEVIPFCKGHSWDNGCNEVKNYEELFESVWRRIEARSRRMIRALLEKQNEESMIVKEEEKYEM